MEFDDVEKSCAVCESSGKFTCGGCKNVHYCSQAHQKQNWKIHKETCSPFKTTIDLENGKEHLIATRDLKPGITVLEESAAFYSPLWFPPIEVDGEIPEDRDLKRLCITCGKLLQFQELEYNSYNSCSKCSWPVCSVACQNNPMHAENECKLFAEYGITFPPLELEESAQMPLPPIMLAFSGLVGMIRGMSLKQKDPKFFSNFEAFLEDQTMTDKIEEIVECASMLLIVLKLIMYKDHRSSPVTELLKLPLINGNDEEDYLKVCSIIQLKQFVVTKMHHMWGDPCTKSASYLYLKASSLSHSCVPNCYWTIGPRPDYKIRIRTTVPVKKGDRLTMNSLFLPGSLHGQTASRQNSLRRHGIVCKCDRCMDPSELGLFFSAMACPLCKKAKKVSNTYNSGYLLPVNPVLGYETLWKCNSEGCGHTMKGAEYQKTIEVVTSELEETDKRRLEKISVNQSDKTKAGNLYWDEFETEAVKIGEKYGLHPNNSIIYQTVKTCVVASFDVQEIQAQLPEVVRRRILRLLYCLGIDDKVNPGLSGEKARLHVMIVKLLSSLLVSPKWIQSMPPEKVRSYHKIFKNSCAEAFKFYRGEFCEPNETMNVQADMVSKVATAIEKLQLPWLK